MVVERGCGDIAELEQLKLTGPWNEARNCGSGSGSGCETRAYDLEGLWRAD